MLSCTWGYVAEGCRGPKGLASHIGVAMRRLMLTVIAIGFFAINGLRSQEAGTDKKKIQGTWNVISIEAVGMKELPAEALKASKITFTADKVTIDIGGDKAEATYTLD